MKITVTHDDGTTADITEGVQVAYDTATGSMDWGSGFLDLEEMEAMARLGEACRFEDFDALLRQIQKTRERQDRLQEIADREAASRRQRDEQRRQMTEEQRRVTWTEVAAGLTMLPPAQHGFVISKESDY